MGSVLDGRYRIEACSARAAWAASTRPSTPASAAPSRSRSCTRELGASREAAQRFQREALASGRLDHPNIVAVSDFGVLEDGSLFLVMEALEGEPLGKRLEREKRIPWHEALAIMRGVLAGLRHAHDKDVVHRDIKPDNIFLAKKDGEHIVKILDFGIAKLIAGNADDPATTRAGLTVGTPAYLSPEQAVGGAITPASDLYSTSVVLYEMLTGRPPFEDDEPLAMLTAHVWRDVPPFAEVAPDLHVPPGLEEVILPACRRSRRAHAVRARVHARRSTTSRVPRASNVGGAARVARRSIACRRRAGVATHAGMLATPTPGSPHAHMMGTPKPAPLTPMAPMPTSRATRPVAARDGDRRKSRCRRSTKSWRS